MRGERDGLLARLTGLVRGWLAGFVRAHEERSPGAVFERAIGQRLEHYRELKDAIAGILYTRNKLAAEIDGRREEIAHLAEDLRRALGRGDDAAALVAIERRQALLDELEHAERELAGLQGEADDAKASLLRFRDDIRSLERERGRALVTVASARARRRIHAALEGLSVDADVRALETVREHVARLALAGGLERELSGDGELGTRLRRLRLEARGEAARRELAELKGVRAPAEIQGAA